MLPDDIHVLKDYLTAQGIRFVEHRLQTDYQFALEDGVQKAPFVSGSLGIHWKEREIHTCGYIEWPHILHEAGHILCEPVHPNHKDSADNSFLGWEMAVVQHLGLSWMTWYKNNRDYGLCDEINGTFYDEIGSLKYESDDFKCFTTLYLDDAKSRKLVAEDGTPLSVR